MLLVTADEMRAIDNYAIKVLEIPSIILMENAALKVIKNINTEIRDTFAVVCGVGNNGGDGLAVARGLIGLDKDVYTYIIGDVKKGSEEFKINLKALKNISDKVKIMETIEDIQSFPEELKKVNMVIDALLGTGLRGQVRGMEEYVINTINNSRIYTLSIDVPSGIDSTSGRILGACIDPSMVVVLGAMKKGLLSNPYLRADIKLEYIGIPKIAYKKVLKDKYEDFNINI